MEERLVEFGIEGLAFVDFLGGMQEFLQRRRPRSALNVSRW